MALVNDTRKQPPASRWKFVRYSLFVVLVGLVAWQVYPYAGDLFALLRRQGLAYPWVAAGVVVQISEYAIDGYLIRALFRRLGFALRTKDTIRVAALDVFAIHFLPVGNLGSLVAFVYFYRRLGVRMHAVVLVNLVSTFVSVFILAVLFIVASAALRGETFPIPVQTYFLGALALSAPVLLVLLLIFLRSDTFRRSVSDALLRFRWYGVLQKSLDRMHDLAAMLATQRAEFLTLLAAKNTYAYVSDMIILFTAGLALHTVISPFLILFAYVVAVVVGEISLLPGGIGAADAILLLVLAAGGTNPSVALGVILLNRLVSFLVPLPLGVFAFLTLRRGLGQTDRRAGRSPDASTNFPDTRSHPSPRDLSH